MSKKFSRTLAPLAFDLEPTVLLPLLHGSAAAAALLALLYTPWPPMLRLLTVFAVLALTYVTRPRQSVCHLHFDRGWRASHSDGRRECLRLRSAAVWPALIVLRFDVDISRARRALVLLPHMLERDDWRRLRLLLAQADVFEPQREV